LDKLEAIGKSVQKSVDDLKLVDNTTSDRLSRVEWGLQLVQWVGGLIGSAVILYLAGQFFKIIH
jgi:hypothetical protein